MTGQELDKALSELSLNVPEAEREDLALATKFIEEIKLLVRKGKGIGESMKNNHEEADE